jgi:undecaprenyl-diphosphatase
MQFVDSVILGIVEGVTEFLPISSTGHLIVAGHLLGQTGDVEKTFEIFIQLGAILAVVVLYWERFLLLFRTDQQKPFSGLRGWMLLAITSFPAALLGLLAHDAIKTYLFNPTTVAWALLVGGIAIIVIEQLKLKTFTESLDELTVKQALMIGLFQCLSLWPGTSRAASTIVGGLFSGLNRKIAAEYSFLAAVPIMCMATLYDLKKSIHLLHASDLPIFALGFVVSFVSAILAIKFFIQLLQKSTLVPFGVYRVVAGLVFIVLLYLGVMH